MKCKICGSSDSVHYDKGVAVCYDCWCSNKHLPYPIIRGFADILRCYFDNASITIDKDHTVTVEVPCKFIQTFVSDDLQWSVQQVADLINWLIKDQDEFMSTMFEVVSK